MALQKFDELKSLPFEQYFGEMRLSNTEKKLRISLAEKLEREFFFVFDLISYYLDADIEDIDLIAKNASTLYKRAINDYVVMDKDLENYIDKVCKEIVKVTFKHKDDSYYTSDDRATYIAENEANTVMNYEQLQEALASGKTKKTWFSVKDNNVRDTHMFVDGETKPISEPFIVGGSKLMYPKDTSLGASLTEIINCRCSVQYS